MRLWIVALVLVALVGIGLAMHSGFNQEFGKGSEVATYEKNTNTYEHQYTHSYQEEGPHGNMYGNGTNNSSNSESRTFSGHMHRGHWKGTQGYLRFQEKRGVALQTLSQFKIKLQEWQKAREQCLNFSNCTDYVNKSKEMIFAGIDAAIARLETLESSEADEIISQLEDYRAQIEDMDNITELREIYPEVRELIREGNQLFRRYAMIDLIDTYLSITDELKDQFPEEAAQIEEKLLALKENVLSIDLAELRNELRNIRIEIMTIYR